TGGRTVTERLGWAVEAAGRAIDSGAAADTLERWVRATSAPCAPVVEAPVTEAPVTRVATAA
ncbi:hypothetical protein R6M67_27060, partial [Streptomyces sp. Wh19]|nr:hypothetical protein [Streptomyces sp. Wh19]